MKHLLGGVALAVLVAAGAPVWARSATNPTAGAPIIPPADPAATKPAAADAPAAKPAASPPAATAASVAAAPVSATAIRHDRPTRHRYVRHRRYAWHRHHLRLRHWWRGPRSDRVAETLNLEELHRIMPPRLMARPAALR